MVAPDAQRRLARAYCLSEPQAGSDVSGIKTKAVREGDEYVISGIKQWISNGSYADYYILFARTSDEPKHGLSAFIVPAGTPGMTFGRPEKKLGLHCDITTQVMFDGARIPAANLIGEEGAGMRVALSALDVGRLGIAAVRPASPRPPWPTPSRTPASASSSAS